MKKDVRRIILALRLEYVLLEQLHKIDIIYRILTRKNVSSVRSVLSSVQWEQFKKINLT